jgi:hypothetical protein
MVCTFAWLLLAGCTGPSKKELQKEYQGWPIQPYPAELQIQNTKLRLARSGPCLWLLSSAL